MRGEDGETTLDQFLKKFRATMSDSCNAQKNVNQVMLDLFAASQSSTGEKSEIEMIRAEMRDFYCWSVPPHTPTDIFLTSQYDA